MRKFAQVAICIAKSGVEQEWQVWASGSIKSEQERGYEHE